MPENTMLNEEREPTYNDVVAGDFDPDKWEWVKKEEKGAVEIKGTEVVPYSDDEVLRARINTEVDEQNRPKFAMAAEVEAELVQRKAKSKLFIVVEKKKLMSEGRFVHLLDEAGVVDFVVKFKLEKPDAEEYVTCQGAQISIEFDRKVSDGSKSKHHKSDVVQINSKRIEIKLIDQRTLTAFTERDLSYLEDPQPDKIEIRRKAGLAGWLGETEEIKIPQPAKRTIIEGLYINNKIAGKDGTVEELFADAVANPIKDYWDNTDQLLERQGAYLRREAEDRDSQRRTEERLREQRNTEIKREVDVAVKERVKRIMENLESQGEDNGGWNGNERVYPDNNGGYHIYRGSIHLRAYPDGFGGFHIRKA